MEEYYRRKYNVDIAMCIDATGSMGGFINKVKENAHNLYSNLRDAVAEKGKYIDELRVRVIAFRDYIADGENAMLTSDFYSLPADVEELESFLNSIQAVGGGDDPEDGLEALAYAIKSDWTTGGDKRRHIIIVWSDDGTHELGFASKTGNHRAFSNIGAAEAERNAARYPEKMPRDFNELSAWWGNYYQNGLMDNNAKRLLIFAPAKEYWSTIAGLWDNVIHFPSEAGAGLMRVEYLDVLSEIAHSI